MIVAVGISAQCVYVLIASALYVNAAANVAFSIYFVHPLIDPASHDCSLFDQADPGEVYVAIHLYLTNPRHKTNKLEKLLFAQKVRARERCISVV